MNIKAFTLVELLVGITISMLLMVSVWIFITTWMNNINIQQKVLSDNKSLVGNISKLQSIIINSEKLINSYWSGFLLKKQQNFDEWGYTYVWVKEINKEYCSEWENLDTQHVFMSNFIPYEEIWENINTDFDEILESEVVTVWWIDYKSDIKNHQIIDITNNITAIWRDIYWDTLSGWAHWTPGTEVFLNSPTWLADVDWKLVFSDTLNNRILYLSWWLVYPLLDEKNGLKEPTGLVYFWSNLYISNSAKGEILKLSSKNYPSNPNLDISFDPESTFSADRFTLEFLTWSILLDSTMDKTNFTTVPQFNWADKVLPAWGWLEYYYINNFWSASPQSGCNNTELRKDWTDVIQCSSYGTWALANFSTNTFNSGNNYQIELTWISPDLTDKEHYYVWLEFSNWVTSEYKKYFPYFTQSDDNIFTKDDNTLEIFAWNLLYPTWLDVNWWKLEIHTFEDRKIHIFNINWTKDTENVRPSAFSITNFNDYWESWIVHNPIKNIEITSLPDFLNIKIDYYKMLNCFNPEEKVEKTLLFKKSF